MEWCPQCQPPWEGVRLYMAPKEPPQGLLEELVKRYLQGDGQAGEQLLTKPAHRQKLEILARKHTTGTSVPWEEAAQQAHLKVLQAARNGSFRQGGAREFYSWAARVAENAIIDTVRREKRKLGGRRLKSLDEHLPETDMTLGESIADDLDLWDAVERGDLILKAREAIETIDRRYPKKGYLALWRGLVQEKDLSQIAAALGVKQPEISKRWRELSSRIAGELGLLSLEQVEREVRAIRQGSGKGRKRSDTQW